MSGDRWNYEEPEPCGFCADTGWDDDNDHIVPCPICMQVVSLADLDEILENMP